MNPQQSQIDYIKQERAKGVPDSVILQNLNTQPKTPVQRSAYGELVPAAFSIAGGLAGGALGGFGGPAAPFTVPAGAIGGAAIGGSAGEAIQQRIETGFGLREKMNSGQIAAQGAISGATQLIGGGVLKAFGFGAKVAKPTVAKFFSKLSGYDDVVLQSIMSRSSGAVEGVARGEAALKDVVVNTAKGISQLAKRTLQEGAKTVKTLDKDAIISGPGAQQELLKQGQNFITRTVQSLRSNYNIGVNKAGQLTFDRPNITSNIVSGGDRSAIQSAFDSLYNIQVKPTIRNIDSVLEKLIVLRSKTPVGSPTGPETRAIIGDMSENIVNFVKSVPPSFGKGWANYAKYLEQSLPKRVMISDAKELFGATENLSPKEISIISKRMMQLFNTGNLAQREFAETIGKEVGTQIPETAAGTLVNTGGMVSQRAPELTKPGIISAAIQAIPKSVVQNYVKTGNILPQFNSVVNAAAKASGVTVAVLMQDLINLTANKTTD